MAARRLTGSAGQPHSGACSPAAAGRGRAGAARGGAGRHVPRAMCRASHPAARLASLCLVGRPGLRGGNRAFKAKS